MTSGNYANLSHQAMHRSPGVAAKLRSGARRLALSAAAALDRRTQPRFLRCLYAHYVFDDQRHAFERTIVELKRVGTFVDTATCVRMLNGEQPIDRPYFHLSFDDGFRNNWLNAVPVLRAHAVPAAFFVPSALIGADWERTRAYCIDTAGYSGVIEMLRWDDLRQMVDLGFEIGSHTRTHARFSELSRDPARMDDEILGSKRELEAGLQRECRYISWPFGTLGDADTDSLRHVQSSQYAACFGAYRGSVRPGSTSRFSIPRHHFEAHWKLSHVLYFARGNRESQS